jgi:hypothetical protein
MRRKTTNKKRKEDFNISFRLFDEQFNVIFDLNKKNLKKGLKEIDKLMRLKLDESIDEILKKK